MMLEDAKRMAARLEVTPEDRLKKEPYLRRTVLLELA
jgi:hypothetical protein